MKILIQDPEDASLVYFITSARGVSNAQIAASVKSYPGVGQPFLAFHNNSIPTSLEANGVAWNPAAYPAPIVNEDADVNLANINAMLADQLLQAVPNASVFAQP